METGSGGSGGTDRTDRTDKLKNIIEGWKNLIWLDPRIEKLAITRAGICADCESNKLSICIKCNCWIPAKVRAITEKCPIAKW